MSTLLATELFQTGPDPYFLRQQVVFTTDNALTEGLAYDPTDGLFHVKTLPAGTIGDVVGPAASVATQVPRYADATGKLLDASNVTIDNAGNMVLPTGSVTITAGNLDIPLPVNGSTTVGLITLAGTRFIHSQSSTTDYNLFVGIEAGNSTTTGTSNVCVGSRSTAQNAPGAGLSTGAFNTVLGCIAGRTISTGGANLVAGYTAGSALNNGNNNVILGAVAATGLSSGSNNILIGQGVGSTITTGLRNVIIGTANGSAALTDAISIGSATAQNAEIRLGILGTQTTCFVQGIDGVTTAGAAVAVLVDASGQLGTISSALKYKEQIEHISEVVSAKLHKLRPVSFVYKKMQVNEDGSRVQHYGLVADEVRDVFPELVTTKKGEPETVRYDAMFGLMLAEIQSLKRQITLLSRGL